MRILLRVLAMRILLRVLAMPQAQSSSLHQLMNM